MERVKRPVLDREGPVRGWDSVLDPNGGAPQHQAAPNAEATETSQDPIVRGVVLGGRVVDEWIRQAQQTARLLGGTSATGAWPDASGRLFKATSDLMAAWLSMLGAAPQNGAGPWASAQPGGATSADPGWRTPYAHEPSAAHEPKRTEPPRPESSSSIGRLRLELSSRRPVEVILDLRTRAAAYRVLDLRSEASDVPRIQGLVLDACDEGGMRLRLTVPDDQPGGTYHAVVLDAAGDCAIGTITLKLPE